MIETLEFNSDVTTITATLNYLFATGEAPFTYSEGPGLPEILSVGTQDPRTMTIHDGRNLATHLVLDCHGFRFLRHDTKVVDFLDKAEIRTVYYPEIEALVKAETGAARVVLFDPTLRATSADLRAERGLREPVLRVHMDFTERSASQPVRDLLPGEAETLLKRRFAIVQVWRPIRQAVESFPLAVADARSILPTNMVVAKRYYPKWEGETYSVTYHPGHRWYWFPCMRPDEALLFKVFDSITDGRARWIAHTAFVDPTTPPQAHPRESIEIRAIAFY